MFTYCRYKDLAIIGNFDFDFVNYPNDRKSASSYTFMMVRKAIMWKNVKQLITSTFIIEVEYVTYYETTYKASCLRSIIYGFKVVECIFN